MASGVSAQYVDLSLFTSHVTYFFKSGEAAPLKLKADPSYKKNYDYATALYLARYSTHVFVACIVSFLKCSGLCRR